MNMKMGRSRVTQTNLAHIIAALGIDLGTGNQTLL